MLPWAYPPYVYYLEHLLPEYTTLSILPQCTQVVSPPHPSISNYITYHSSILLGYTTRVYYPSILLECTTWACYLEHATWVYSSSIAPPPTPTHPSISNYTTYYFEYTTRVYCLGHTTLSILLQCAQVVSPPTPPTHPSYTTWVYFLPAPRPNPFVLPNPSPRRFSRDRPTLQLNYIITAKLI